MDTTIGTNKINLQGYGSFVPCSFPPTDIFNIPTKILHTAAKAERLIGKLDGVTHILPDVNF